MANLQGKLPSLTLDYLDIMSAWDGKTVFSTDDFGFDELCALSLDFNPVQCASTCLNYGASTVFLPAASMSCALVEEIPNECQFLLTTSPQDAGLQTFQQVQVVPTCLPTCSLTSFDSTAMETAASEESSHLDFLNIKMEQQPSLSGALGPVMPTTSGGSSASDLAVVPDVSSPASPASASTSCNSNFGIVPQSLPSPSSPRQPPATPLSQAQQAAAAAAAAARQNSGECVVRTRSECLERYRFKKARRMYTKKIRYQLRKINADKRPRIKGRFVKKCEGVGAGLGELCVGSGTLFDGKEESVFNGLGLSLEEMGETCMDSDMEGEAWRLDA
mmetsp:Transcript_10290/g.22073  ORF Transcript_10290/g.22073 Transcript_10290/m.22073 type:complete len:332 (+) Transcript_10290:199-1194(+)|eukprot:CAMPEP_0202902618 /NCGR_PEP_ID=MMETSP1392-20130828/16953_1 /ASSEMBLY_ACC=CAM_ASM_000868 /TAXON_ID=225041 /ORGANISM="Chlamydomonas chlamydogama, Strain SAG 11-48b" /LENGTH=331 /DNA_ID=CAMNT_0049589409 /DNA_START=115 /DNA_END=1110 /DNA_ORIENTATION=-